MDRRKALKSFGLAAVLGSTGILAACAQQKKDETSAVSAKNDTTSKAPEASVSKREKLIVNRKPMSFHDPEKPSDFEYKHTPDITIGDKNAKGFTRVDVLIGSKGIIHPTEDNHWIDYIKLWQNDQLIGNVEFEIGVAGGFASFYVNLAAGDKLKAEAGCNLHGIWTSLVEA